VGAVVGMAAVEAAATKVLALGIPALADEEHLWLATTLLALLSCSIYCCMI
jgi:hypothetical protein